MFVQALIILNYHITALTKPDLPLFLFLFLFSPGQIHPNSKRAPLKPLRQDKYPLLIGHAPPELGLKAPPSFYRCLTLARTVNHRTHRHGSRGPIRTGGCATWAGRASFGTNKHERIHGCSLVTEMFSAISVQLPDTGGRHVSVLSMLCKYSKAPCHGLLSERALVALEFWGTIFLLPPPRRNI